MSIKCDNVPHPTLLAGVRPGQTFIFITPVVEGNPRVILKTDERQYVYLTSGCLWPDTPNLAKEVRLVKCRLDWDYL